MVIATGSKARIPDIPGLKEVSYLTNKTIFDLENLQPVRVRFTVCCQ
ncbi:MAG: hypothetical protein K8R28_04630 [Desulfobacterales bacterium]|nr:hypothetical protein [Desulfobacterales bacterium]